MTRTVATTRLGLRRGPWRRRGRGLRRRTGSYDEDRGDDAERARETGTSPRTTSRTPRRWRLHAARLRPRTSWPGGRSDSSGSRACGRPWRPRAPAGRSPAEAPARGRRRGPARNPRPRARGAVRSGFALAARGRQSAHGPGEHQWAARSRRRGPRIRAGDLPDRRRGCRSGVPGPRGRAPGGQRPGGRCGSRSNRRPRPTLVHRRWARSPRRPRAPKERSRKRRPARWWTGPRRGAVHPGPADEPPGETEAQASAEPVEVPVASAIFVGNVEGAEVRLDGELLGVLPDVTAEDSGAGQDLCLRRGPRGVRHPQGDVRGREGACGGQGRPGAGGRRAQASSGQCDRATQGRSQGGLREGGPEQSAFRAAIYVDGKKVNRVTPVGLSSPLELPVGEHTIVFKLGSRSSEPRKVGRGDAERYREARQRADSLNADASNRASTVDRRGSWIVHCLRPSAGRQVPRRLPPICLPRPALPRGSPSAIPFGASTASRTGRVCPATRA